MATITGGN